MFFINSPSPFLFLVSYVAAVPVSTSDLSDPSVGPQPGLSPYYSDYRGKTDAFPANSTNTVIPPIEQNAAAPDDLLFQNLLSAEWAIYSFYQQGVERFNASAFTSAGFPNTTYDRITEIRDNEAGHLRIFQDQISASSIKSGRCAYDYGYTDAESYLAVQTALEVSSMAFLTGLVRQAKTDTTRSALLAIAEVESRHNTWALIDLWKTDPFAGPVDTVYPYANHILDLTTAFIIPGSCPSANPPYPYPVDAVVRMTHKGAALPGANITFVFENVTASGQKGSPVWKPGQQYYAVFFHALTNISVPFAPVTSTVVLPSAFQDAKGITVAVIADAPGAPVMDSVVAGPDIMVHQPAFLNSQV